MERERHPNLASKILGLALRRLTRDERSHLRRRRLPGGPPQRRPQPRHALQPCHRALQSGTQTKPRQARPLQASPPHQGPEPAILATLDERKCRPQAHHEMTRASRHLHSPAFQAPCLTPGRRILPNTGIRRVPSTAAFVNPPHPARDNRSRLFQVKWLCSGPLARALLS